MENSGVLTGTTDIYSNTLSVKGKGVEGGRERREREEEEREGEEREREEREGVVDIDGREREWWAVREEGGGMEW